MILGKNQARTASPEVVGVREPDSTPIGDERDSDELMQLVAAARGGDAPAQNELFRQLRTYLLYVANEQVADQLQAKLGPSDIVQQSLVRAVEKFSEYRGTTGAEFKGWLRQILVNEVRLARRGYAADKRDVRREVEFTGEGATEAPGGQRDPPAKDLTPRAQALADEQAEIVQGLLEQLPENLRTVVRLRNWEELSFEEIGQRLNMSTSGVAKIWYRALVELQRLFQQQHESPRS